MSSREQVIYSALLALYENDIDALKARIRSESGRKQTTPYEIARATALAAVYEDLKKGKDNGKKEG